MYMQLRCVSRSYIIVTLHVYKIFLSLSDKIFDKYFQELYIVK